MEKHVLDVLDNVGGTKTCSVNGVLNPFPNKSWFLRVCSRSLLKTPWEKEKLLVMSNFSFSHSVFYPFGEESFLPFPSNLKLLSANSFSWNRLKFVVWERVNASAKKV